MTCKHNWHFKGERSNMIISYKWIGTYGFVPKVEVPKEGRKLFVEFICDKCMKIKIKEIKEVKNK